MEIIVENPYTFDNSPFFYVRMKSTSLFLVTTLKLNRSYEAQLMRRFYTITTVKMVETFYDLCQSSMFTTTFTAKPGLSFFFPLGNLSLDPGGKKTRIVRVLLR